MLLSLLGTSPISNGSSVVNTTFDPQYQDIFEENIRDNNVKLKMLTSKKDLAHIYAILSVNMHNDNSIVYTSAN